MPPHLSLLRSVVTLCPCWPAVELFLYHPHSVQNQTLICTHTHPPCRLLFPPVPVRLHLPSIHLSWGHRSASHSSTAPLCTATLGSCPLPAGRWLIAIGGEERIAARHGRPLESTEPGQGHSHHSSQTAKMEKERVRDAGVSGKKDKAAVEGWSILRSTTILEFILFLKLVFKSKALGYHPHITCLFTPFDEIFRRVCVWAYR